MLQVHPKNDLVPAGELQSFETGPDSSNKVFKPKKGVHRSFGGCADLHNDLFLTGKPAKRQAHFGRPLSTGLRTILGNKQAGFEIRAYHESANICLAWPTSSAMRDVTQRRQCRSCASSTRGAQAASVSTELHLYAAKLKQPAASPKPCKVDSCILTPAKPKQTAAFARPYEKMTPAIRRRLASCTCLRSQSRQ